MTHRVMNNDRLRTLAEIRDAIDNELQRGAADDLAPAVAGVSAPKVLGKGEIAALEADRRLVQDALDAQDRYRLTNDQVFELARRRPTVYSSTSQRQIVQDGEPIGSTPADPTMTVSGDRRQRRPMRWSLSPSDYRVSL